MNENVFFGFNPFIIDLMQTLKLVPFMLDFFAIMSGAVIAANGDERGMTKAPVAILRSLSD
ncbi:hypothetical protein J2T58_000070 [Methanocalculus alkaliphilus]|uniref:hypothetical protein n=1 Tax=Methanocalculus alkaliphilus TaxID=768730 RepID=UPI00209E9276|nr:hypothetical protein [Methanocalculus alkaliphilus]MCP1714243.1 hypothetical protein [Methanocalculus alkaliphilus]